MNRSISHITYTTDVIDGNKLIITVPETGWVECARDHCKVYASKSFPDDFYNSNKKTVVQRIRTSWPKFESNFGFVNHLANVLQNENFIMPAFSYNGKRGLEVTCGHSRFMAHSFSGKNLSTFGLVILSSKDFDHPLFTEIKSTDQFNEFYNLQEVDYEIGLTLENSTLTVTTSILRHTLYNVNDPLEDKTIAWLQKDIENFWTRFINESTKKINVKVHCLPEHRKFINSSNIFDIKFIDEESGWAFSHGKLLGAFRKDGKEINTSENRELVVWLFDITESFDLELILPLMKFGTTCIYTENKKAVIFDQVHYSDFKIIGNIVK